LRREGSEVQGDDRSQVPRGGHHRQPGEHHVEVRLQAELIGPMPGEANCIFTKGLIPFVEKEVGAEGVAAICRLAGRSRDYLMADHNWIPLVVAGATGQGCQALMHEPDEERWARRYAESFMDWKPREERSYLGTYSMGIGSPRAAYERVATIYGHQSRGLHRLDILE